MAICRDPSAEGELRRFGVGQDYGALAQVLDDALLYPLRRLNFVRNTLPTYLFGKGARERVRLSSKIVK
jgi:hypothetical protein